MAVLVDQVMVAYGYNIEHILMVDIVPDHHVRSAMNEINAGHFHLFLSGFISELQLSGNIRLCKMSKFPRFGGHIYVNLCKEVIPVAATEHYICSYCSKNRGPFAWVHLLI